MIAYIVLITDDEEDQRRIKGVTLQRQLAEDIAQEVADDLCECLGTSNRPWNTLGATLSAEIEIVEAEISE